MNILIVSPNIPVSYTGKGFSEIIQWRDESTSNIISDLARRIISQVVLMTLFVTGSIEFWLHAFCYLVTKQSDSPIKAVNAMDVVLLSGRCMLYNLFVKKISPIFQTAYAEMSPDNSLLLAVRHGYYTMAQTALKNGADPHKKLEQETLSLTQRLYGRKEMQKLFPLNSYEKLYIKSKLLSHWLELRGEVELKGQKVDLEGGAIQAMRQSIVDSFQAFHSCKGFSSISLGDTKAQALQEALSSAYNPYSNPKIKKDLQSKDLLFINTRWEDHGICLVLFGDYMCIANGGPGADLYSTLKIYRIDRSCLTQEILEDIWSRTTSKEEQSIEYFYNKLPAKLRAKTDALHDLFQMIAPPLAISGNCTLSSMQIALRFAWAMLLNPSPTPETLRQAQLESNLFLNWAAVRYVETLQPKKEFQDPVFLSQIAASAQQKNRNFVKTFHLLHAIATKKFSFLSSLWQKDYTLLRPLTACYYHCSAKPFAWRHFSHFSPEESLLEN